MRKVLIILGVVLLVFVLVFLAKDAIIKTSVEKGVELVTGLPLTMQSFKVGIVNTMVGIKGLMLHNPKGFNDNVMIDMPEIYVHYDLPAIFKGMIHLQEVRLDLREFVVVKNEAGVLNLDSLKAVQAQKGAKKPAAEKAKQPKIAIDKLELKIGKVVYKDYSRKGAPSIKEFNVNINEKFSNITDPNALVSVIVVKALMNTTIASLTNFDLGGLKGTVTGTLADAEKLVGDTAAMAGTVAKQATKQAGQAVTEATKITEGAVKGVGGSVEKASEGIKDVFNALPFGSKKEK
jgi:hypothetical protein